VHDRESEAQLLMSLYDFTPRMILYDKDFSDLTNSDVHEITKTSSLAQLNPIEVVLESVVSKKAEEISQETVTCSNDTVLLNADLRRKAIGYLVEQVKADDQFLKELHQAWLQDLKEYVRHEMKNDITPDELVFRIGMRYRISASSAARALKATTSTH
jgi:O-phosphoseryl-tRNA(Cys) synthetase